MRRICGKIHIVKEKSEEEIKAYLAKIRKTIADSKALVAQAELRMAETDRMLESQGLTRDQVKAWSFTPEQIEMANRELERQGQEPFLQNTGWGMANAAEAAADGWETGYGANSSAGWDANANDEIEMRRKKFLMMMKPFHI